MTERSHRGFLQRLLHRGNNQAIPEAADNPGAVEAPEADINISILERLDAIERRLVAMAHQAQAAPSGAPATGDGAIAGLQQAIAALEKQIGRAGREQLKTSSLIETQLQHFEAGLEALRAADARRDAEIAAMREQQRAMQSAARVEVVRAILPAVDSLDEALRSGERVLAQAKIVPGRRGLLERLRRRPEPAPAPVLHENMAAWLTGLTFVRRRLLEALAAEDVRPMAAEGQPFDPQRHVAVEVVPAGEKLPPGTVANVLREGYLVGERVLRHAEVAVSGEQ